MSFDLLWILMVIGLASAATHLRLLTIGGGVAAAIIGLLSLAFGGLAALSLLFLFFLGSNIVGFWRRQKKKELGFEKGGQRDQWQVLANGGPAVAGLVIGALLHHGMQSAVGLALFSAGLAEANADTWATEIGSAAAATPRSITTGKIVPAGRSGGITLPGTFAAALGSSIIAVSSATVFRSNSPLGAPLFIGVAGFVGSLVDSLLGATIQAQYVDQNGCVTETSTESSRLVQGFPWLRNDVVNFSAGLSSLLIYFLLGYATR